MHGNNKAKESSQAADASKSPPLSPSNSPPFRPLDPEDFDFDTLAIHADHRMENAPDIAPPMHLSTTYKLNNPDNLVYSRAGLF